MPQVVAVRRHLGAERQAAAETTSRPGQIGIVEDPFCPLDPGKERMKHPDWRL